MDTKFPEVPAFSSSFLALADVCARELWVGRGYDDGKVQVGRAPTIRGAEGKYKENHLSDEIFLYLCSGRFMYQALSNRYPAPHRITEAFVRNDFMRVARLNALNTRISNLNIAHGIDYLHTSTVLDYQIWKHIPTPDYFSIFSYMFIETVGDAFFTPTNSNLWGSQIALASRLLFFTIPDAPIYNFSSDIAAGLGLSGYTTTVQLPYYIDYLHHGYKKNWCNLSKFEMPTSNLINPQIWNRARNAGWWQRRVYDLALVMYFEFVAKNKPIKLSKYVKQQFSTMPYTHI
jgi:hypothetical protein